MRRIFTVALMSLLVLVSGYLHAFAQANSDRVKSSRVSVQVKNKPVYDVFLRLMYVYDIPIGFEESILDREHDDYFFQTNVPPEEERRDFDRYPKDGWNPAIRDHLVSLDFSNVPVGNVLDALVDQMGNYKWEIRDGVVNIFPITDRDSRFVNLLDLQIKSFSMAKGEEVGLVQPRIVFNLPEIAEFLRENELRAESYRMIPWFTKRPLPENFTFSNLTFRELLNGITRLKRGGWILRSDKSKKVDPTGREAIEILL